MDELCKNQIYTAEIEGYTSTGAGVCRINGRAVFVERVLVGEVWQVLILKVTKSAVYGKGLNLISPCADRREPPCPIFGKCGGCDLMHMSYEEELRLKLSRVNDAIKHVAGLDFIISEIFGADDNATLRYRNKAIFAVGENENGCAQTGFFRERSHDIISAPDCLIQTELSVRCAAALCSFMDENKIASYNEETGKGQIRHLFMRCSTRLPQSVACIVSAKGLHEHTAGLVQALRGACPELTGIVLCINKTRGNTVLAGDFHTLWGSDIIEDELCGLKFKISPLSFYQINPPQAEKLYNRALEYAGTDRSATVLDLYCGAGTISLCLAKGAKFVYGAEIVEAAVENAWENAKANGIENVQFFCADAGNAAKELEIMGVSIDVVVVDPPRKGLSEEVISTIVKMSPQRVVYVSCDPGTLARDMKLFSRLGYAPQTGTAVDMFPKCAHVESIILMTCCVNAKK